MLRLITLGRLRLVRDGFPGQPVHLQPKRLALLAYLALAPEDGFQQRDTLLALFWPRSDQDRARRCLRQALFHLRNELGHGVIARAGREGIALAPAALWCDAAALEGALRGRRRREALDLYGGDFLPGLCVDDCSGELEQWVQQTRRRLKSGVAACAWELVDEELRKGRPEAALDTAGRARALSPDDEQGLRRHMVLLASLGDRAAALGAFAEFSRRLREEFEAEPSVESRRLVQDLRGGRLPEAGLDMVDAAPRDPAPVAPRARRGRQRLPVTSWVRLAVLLGALGLGGLAVRGRELGPSTPAGRHLVLAEFVNHTHDSLLGAAVTSALRADLSEIAEVRSSSGEPMPTGAPVALVTGEIAALGSGFAVSARLVSAASGQVLAVVKEDAADSGDLLRSVERLSRRLRTSVTRSLAPPAQPSLGRRIAASVESFRRYARRPAAER